MFLIRQINRDLPILCVATFAWLVGCTIGSFCTPEPDAQGGHRWWQTDASVQEVVQLDEVDGSVL